MRHVNCSGLPDTTSKPPQHLLGTFPGFGFAGSYLAARQVLTRLGGAAIPGESIGCASLVL